jgi:DNA polymerase-4
VIKPHHVLAFLAPLPVGKIPGVGKVTQAHLQRLGLYTVGELHDWSQYQLEKEFGRYGLRLYQLARGIDNSTVEANRPVQSISAEDTFAIDRVLNELHDTVCDNAKRVWASSRKVSRRGRTVVLKLKTAEFKTLTRSVTPPQPPQSETELINLALSLLQKVDQPADTLYRLVGVGLSNFDDEQTMPELPFD